MESKNCNKCGESKPLIDGFYADKGCKDGKRGTCKECDKAASRAWSRANPEKKKELHVKWLMSHPEANRDRAIKWYRDHPERAKAQWHKRRVLKDSYEGKHHTAADIKSLLRTQEGLCAYCGITLDSYHVDHVVPLSRGGGNGADNIALACPFCNLSKRDKLLHVEWIPSKETHEESRQAESLQLQ